MQSVQEAYGSLYTILNVTGKMFSSCKQLENAESFISKEREGSYRCRTEKCIIV